MVLLCQCAWNKRRGRQTRLVPFRLLEPELWQEAKWILDQEHEAWWRAANVRLFIINYLPKRLTSIFRLVAAIRKLVRFPGRDGGRIGRVWPSW